MGKSTLNYDAVGTILNRLTPNLTKEDLRDQKLIDAIVSDLKFKLNHFKDRLNMVRIEIEWED